MTDIDGVKMYYVVRESAKGQRMELGREVFPQAQSYLEWESAGQPTFEAHVDAVAVGVRKSDGKAYWRVHLKTESDLGHEVPAIPRNGYSESDYRESYERLAAELVQALGRASLTIGIE